MSLRIEGLEDTFYYTFVIYCDCNIIMSDDALSCCLNVLRRMPPGQVENDLSGLCQLVPELTDELLQRVDQPLGQMVDPATGRAFLLCDYNRDGDSHR